MASTLPTELALTNQTYIGVAVSWIALLIFPALAHPVPAFFPLGSRFCRYALVDICVGCVLHPCGRYCSTRILAGAWLTPRLGRLPLARHR